MIGGWTGAMQGQEPLSSALTRRKTFSGARPFHECYPSPNADLSGQERVNKVSPQKSPDTSESAYKNGKTYYLQPPQINICNRPKTHYSISFDRGILILSINIYISSCIRLSESEFRSKRYSVFSSTLSYRGLQRAYSSSNSGPIYIFYLEAFSISHQVTKIISNTRIEYIL